MTAADTASPTRKTPAVRPLPRSAPGGVGVDPAGVEAFLDAMATVTGTELHSLMVLRHGQVAVEGWWAPYGPERVHLLYSLSKSFTSTAAGLAAAEGLLSLDDTVLSHFPELDADVTDPRSRTITLADVASMASGHATDTIEAAVRADPVEPLRGFLQIPPAYEPGTFFAYNQPCTYALSRVVQRRSGQGQLDFLRPRLLDPLGVGEVGWIGDLQGRELGFSGLHARTEDIARLGLLYLQGGRWEGRQLLSPGWVAEASRARVSTAAEPNPDWSNGYGFQFWLSRHGFRGDGAYGQFCLVLPEQDAVVVTTAATTDMQGILDAVWAHLLPALSDEHVATGTGSSNEAAEQRLSARLAGLRVPAPDAGPDTPYAGTFTPAGGHCAAQPSLLGIGVDQVDGETTVRVVETTGSFSAGVGSGAWRVTEAENGPGEGGRPPFAAAAARLDDDRLELRLRFLETPHRLDVVCTRAAGTFDAKWHTSPLHAGPLSGLRMPAPAQAGTAPDLTSVSAPAVR